MIADHFDLLQASIKWQLNSTIQLYDYKKKLKLYKVIKWSNIEKSYSKGSLGKQFSSDWRGPIAYT